MLRRALFLSLALALTIVHVLQTVHAAERSPGQVLTEVIGFSESYDAGEAVCLEKVRQVDVEKQVAKTPDLLGGIKPSDPEWREAKALYIGLNEKACRYNKVAAAGAFARALDESQSMTDLEALIAFYRSDLGIKLREASLLANIASYRASFPEDTSEASYTAFGEAIANLLAKRAPSPAPEPEPKRAQAVPDATAALALSDEIMKAIVAGRIEEAMTMAKPHTGAPDAQFDAMIEQLRQQASPLASRFGKSVDHELLRNDTIGDALTRPVFLHRFDHGGMVWSFTWYRGSEGWTLINLRFADDVTLLFR